MFFCVSRLLLVCLILLIEAKAGSVEQVQPQPVAFMHGGRAVAFHEKSLL